MFGALGFLQQTPPTTTKPGVNIGSIASGGVGLLSNLITSAVTPNYNKPEYSPGYYVNMNALFPNGVPSAQAITTPTTAAVSLSSPDSLLVYGGLGLAGIALIFLLSKKKTEK